MGHRFWVRLHSPVAFVVFAAWVIPFSHSEVRRGNGSFRVLGGHFGTLEIKASKRWLLTAKSGSPPKEERQVEKTDPTHSGSVTRVGGDVESSHRLMGAAWLGFKTLSIFFFILAPLTRE